jgi:hypothetical protein
MDNNINDIGKHWHIYLHFSGEKNTYDVDVYILFKAANPCSVYQ